MYNGNGEPHQENILRCVRGIISVVCKRLSTGNTNTHTNTHTHTRTHAHTHTRSSNTVQCIEHLTCSCIHMHTPAHTSSRRQMHKFTNNHTHARTHPTPHTMHATHMKHRNTATSESKEAGREARGLERHRHMAQTSCHAAKHAHDTHPLHPSAQAGTGLAHDGSAPYDCHPNQMSW